MSGNDFWSRRKARAAAEEAEARAAAEAAETEARAAELAARPEAEVLEELGLPDPDTLEEGADFSVFLKAAVPETIRRRALRRLWRSNPVLANLDGLNDYDDDYSQATTPLGGLKTAYKVGRGFLRAAAEEAEDGAPPAGQPPEPEVRAALQDSGKSADPVAETPQPDADRPASGTADGDADPRGETPQNKGEDDQNPVSPTRRRMRFQFLD